jgi:hypothetical protein
MPSAADRQTVKAGFPGIANLLIGGLQNAVQENGAPRKDQNPHAEEPE